MLSNPLEAGGSLVERSENVESFQMLLTFLRLSRGLKLAFAEINFPPDIDELVAALQDHPDCVDIHLALLRLDDPDLRFLILALEEEVAKIEVPRGKKLVLLVRGLEKSIGTVGDYPPVLANMNYARGDYPDRVPYPVVLILPSYAVTRFAQFAPDFWAWTSAVLQFQAASMAVESVRARAFSSPHASLYHPMPNRSERINSLKLLIGEYSDSSETSLRSRLEVFNQLGLEYLSIQQFVEAQQYFQQSLQLSRTLKLIISEADTLHCLGRVLRHLNKLQDSQLILEKSRDIREKISDRVGIADTYHQLGTVFLEMKEYEKARHNYLLALQIKGLVGNKYSQAFTYKRLGRVAEELGEYDEARSNYQKALEILNQFEIRYMQSDIYQDLGIVAQTQGNYEEARYNYQLVLEIGSEFGDRYGKASAYYQLGTVAEELREYEEAWNNYQNSLQICTEFNDDYGMRNYAIPGLRRIYQVTQDEHLVAEMAEVLGKSVAEVRSIVNPMPT